MPPSPVSPSPTYGLMSPAAALKRALAGWVFAHMSAVIPVKRLRETGTLIAFHHPKPSHAFHVLLVPTRAVASLADLPACDTAFLSDLVATVQQLVAEFGLTSYRLILNGGSYQDFPQLHFHLISDDVESTPDRIQG